METLKKLSKRTVFNYQTQYTSDINKDAQTNGLNKWETTIGSVNIL